MTRLHLHEQNVLELPCLIVREVNQGHAGCASHPTIAGWGMGGLLPYPTPSEDGLAHTRPTPGQRELYPVLAGPDGARSARCLPIYRSTTKKREKNRLRFFTFGLLPLEQGLSGADRTEYPVLPFIRTADPDSPPPCPQVLTFVGG